MCDLRHHAAHDGTGRAGGVTPPGPTQLDLKLLPVLVLQFLSKRFLAGTKEESHVVIVKHDLSEALLWSTLSLVLL
jgi:hypothetical protein